MKKKYSKDAKKRREEEKIGPSKQREFCKIRLYLWVLSQKKRAGVGEREIPEELENREEEKRKIMTKKKLPSFLACV